MKPFPKVISVLSICAAVFGALNTTEILSLVPPTWGTIITLGAVVSSALTHSLSGSGPVL